MIQNEAVKTRPRVLLVVRAIVIHNKKILVIQRAPDDDFDPDKWEIPGGKLDIGQDLSHAGEREIIEETGLSVRPLTNLVAYDSFNITEGKYAGLPYINLIGLYQSSTDRVKLSLEHQDHMWLPFEETFDLELTDASRKGLLDWESNLDTFL